MAREIADGVLVEAGELTVDVMSRDLAPGIRPGRGGATRGGGATGEMDALHSALIAADFEIVTELSVAAGAAQAVRGAVAPELTVAVGRDEGAVLLIVAAGGVLHWAMPDVQDDLAPTRRGGAQGGQVRFDLARAIGEALPPPPPAARRGPVLDWVVDKLVEPVRTIVLRFVVAKAIDAAVRRIEGDNPTGPVVIRGTDPAVWLPAPIGETLSQDRPLRILLMVHGTFSSTTGSFGHLATFPEGMAFLDEALKRYDLILGHDHHTLADEPRANAEAMLATLTSLKPPPGSTIDAVAYSRGGLVYRVLVEELLPTASLDVKLGSVVFVGCTNGGTNLAEPQNWAALVDTYTNILVAAARGIATVATGGALSPLVTLSIRTLGRFVQMFSQVAISERRVPGLAAMEPSGVLVQRLNRADAPAAPADYFAVTASFEPRFTAAKGLGKDVAEFIADRVTDRLFAEPNDMVVNTSAMTMFGPRKLDPAAIHALGDGEVYHTIYFATAAVATALTGWLLPTGGGARAIPEDMAPRRRVSLPRSGGGSPPRRRTANRQMQADSFDIGSQGEGSQGEGSQGEKMFDLDRSSGSGFDDRLIRFDAIDDSAPPAAAAADEPLAPAPESAPPPTVDRFIAAEMEPYPKLDRPANVYVTVSPQAIVTATHAAAATSDAAVALDATRLLDIAVIPQRNCTVSGEVKRSIDISEPGEQVVRLTVAGVAPGPAELIVEARQGNSAVASFVLAPIFVADDQPPLAANQALGAAGPADTPYPVLRIYEYFGANGALTLRFDLVCDTPAYAESGEQSLRPGFSLDAYVKDTLDEIEAAWTTAGIAPPGTANAAEAKAAYDAFLSNFRAKAIVRTNGLLPRELREMLWAHRDDIKAIQVVSQEPLLPWELMYVTDPTGQSPERRGFLSEWGLVRWLHGVRPPPRTLVLDGATAHHVVPDYLDENLDLTGAAAERTMLEGKMPGITAVEPTSLGVQAFLAEAGDCGVLHFACHGLAEQRAVLAAELLMRGLPRAGKVIDDPLSADQVKTSLRLAADARTLIFLNSCQTGRSGEGIAGVGGFADAFLRPDSRCGAAAFVGALWSIGDTLSLHFADAFYTALLAGDTLVEAVGKARKACADGSDFTWLAYTVYGNPVARVAKG